MVDAKNSYCGRKHHIIFQEMRLQNRLQRGKCTWFTQNTERINLTNAVSASNEGDAASLTVWVDKLTP